MTPTTDKTMIKIRLVLLLLDETALLLLLTVVDVLAGVADFNVVVTVTVERRTELELERLEEEEVVIGESERAAVGVVSAAVEATPAM
jgi:hypothetical protein